MALPRSQGRGGVPPRPTTWRERLGALRNLLPFLAMVWRTSRLLTTTTLVVRMLRALLPVATLFVGKLIIDEVVHLSHLAIRPVGLAGWLGSDQLGQLRGLLLAEFAVSAFLLSHGLPSRPCSRRKSGGETNQLRADPNPVIQSGFTIAVTGCSFIGMVEWQSYAHEEHP